MLRVLAAEQLQIRLQAVILFICRVWLNVGLHLLVCLLFLQALCDFNVAQDVAHIKFSVQSFLAGYDRRALPLEVVWDYLQPSAVH